MVDALVYIYLNVWCIGTILSKYRNAVFPGIGIKNTISAAVGFS
jgi:hypothetical protein